MSFEEDDLELVEILNLKDIKSSQTSKNRAAKKKNNKKEQRGFWRAHSPDWAIGNRKFNQVKREWDNSEALPKFQEWNIYDKREIKYGFKGLKWPSF